MHYALTDLTANVFNTYSHSAPFCGIKANSVDAEREREHSLSEPSSIILPLDHTEALLEVADIKRRDVKSSTLNSYTVAEWKYTDLFCFGPVSRNLKHKCCIINLQIVLKCFFIYISIP